MINHPNRKKILFTLQAVRDAHPCADGWAKLIKALPKDTPLLTQISLGDVAIANDAADALWCARVLDWSNITVRRRVIAGAVLPTVARAAKCTTDERVHSCVESVEAWCSGAEVDLNAAEKAAWAAARAAASAAQAAVWGARAAAATATASAARAAAETASAAGATPRAAEAAWATTRAAIWATERKKQQADIIKAFPPVILAAK